MDLDLPTELAGDLLTAIEAKAEALRAIGSEGLEQPLADLVVDTHTLITNLDDGEMTLAQGLDMEGAAAGRRLQSVQEQVYEEMIQAARVALDGGHGRVDSDIQLTPETLKWLRSRSRTRLNTSHRDLLFSQNRRPHVGKEPMRQDGEPVKVTLQLAQSRCRIGFSHRNSQRDRREDVPDVVGDRGGERSRDRQLFALDELGLGLGEVFFEI